MVIGPVPPGIGVSQPATSATASKSTSPTMPVSVRDTPTSIDGRAGLDVLGRDHPRLAGGGDEDVGLTAHLGEVRGAAVGERHGGVDALAGEQQRERQADQRGAPDDHGPPAGGLHAVALEQAHHAERRAADEAGPPRRAGPSSAR